MKSAIRSARVAITASAIAIIFALSSYQAQAQQHKAINLAPERGLPFSDGILAGNTLYIAGQEGTDSSDKLVAGGIGPETAAALANIEKVLKAAGFEMNDIVSITVFLVGIHESPDMNKVHKSAMPDPKPARATVQVAALVNNACIEVSAIAIKRSPTLSGLKR